MDGPCPPQLIIISDCSGKGQCMYRWYDFTLRTICDGTIWYLCQDRVKDSNFNMDFWATWEIVLLALLHGSDSSRDSFWSLFGCTYTSHQHDFYAWTFRRSRLHHSQSRNANAVLVMRANLQCNPFSRDAQMAHPWSDTRLLKQILSSQEVVSVSCDSLFHNPSGQGCSSCLVCLRTWVCWR